MQFNIARPYRQARERLLGAVDGDHGEKSVRVTPMSGIEWPEVLQVFEKYEKWWGQKDLSQRPIDYEELGEGRRARSKLKKGKQFSLPSTRSDAETEPIPNGM
jgi:hypothetical protein